MTAMKKCVCEHVVYDDDDDADDDDDDNTKNK